MTGSAETRPDILWLENVGVTYPGGVTALQAASISFRKGNSRFFSGCPAPASRHCCAA